MCIISEQKKIGRVGTGDQFEWAMEKMEIGDDPNTSICTLSDPISRYMYVYNLAYRRH